MPRVSEEHLIARREQILDAARVCFLSKGLHNTSMQDLIQEAGLSVGAVYRYFKSKNEIIVAIAGTVVGTVQEHIDEVAGRRLPLADSMSVVLEAIDQQLGPGGFLPVALQVWSEATIDPTIGAIVKDRYEALRSSIRALVVHAVEDGELAPETDVDATTAVLYGMLPGYALQRMLTGLPDKATYMTGVRALISRR
ncbi:TetR/AcrR family transcriptional regulator [Actinoplanes subtropicus]|uniref:TetR/AcrR family transcriptional regulator n=1 Tax=Actinoplanes subtropicus TaxID=543632 RepID=UPI0004C2BA6F|nr:TetR/AcrR family transcriptional regulator [Actinoplanes subtropicus]